MNNDILSRTKNTFCILGCYILLYDDHIWLISTNGPGAHRCKWAHFNQTGSFLAVWVISYLYELLVGSCIFISNGYWGKLNGSFLLPNYCSKHKIYIPILSINNLIFNYPESISLVSSSYTSWITQSVVDGGLWCYTFLCSPPCS